MFFGIVQGMVYIDAVGIIDTTTDVAQCHDLTAQLVEQTGGDAPHVAKALYHNTTFIRIHLKIKHGIACHKLHAACGRLESTFAAADCQRLSSNYGWYRVPLVHRKGIHHPRHDLWVGIHIRGGYVAIGANQNRDLSGIATREAFELRTGQLVRIADDAALGSSKWDIDNSTFPG